MGRILSKLFLHFGELVYLCIRKFSIIIKRKDMKKVLTLMMMGLLFVTVSQAQQKWTLRQCIEHALQNNISLQKTRLAKRSATEDLRQSQAALLPSLSASTNQSVGYRPWTNSGVATVTNGTVSTSVNKTYYNGSYGLNASWTVWNGNRNRNQVKLNRLAEQQAELDSAYTANSIQEQIAQLYVQILYLNEAIGVNEQSLEASKMNEERGQQMVEIGKMSKADLAQLTAQRATDEYNLVNARSNLASYKLQLKQLLEITDADFDIEIPEASDEEALAEIPSLPSIYEAALNTRPEIENSRLSIRSSDIQLNIARAQGLPTISMTGGIGTSTNSLSTNGWGNQIKTNLDASIGASLSIPILDNRSTRTAINKAKLQQEQALLDLQDQQKKLYSTIEGYWLDAQTNQQKFRAALLNVESEEQSYTLLSEQFQLGLKNIVELMNGKTNLLNAQQNMLQSKYMTILDLQLLKFYKGEI
jgi:outer membrane protein